MSQVLRGQLRASWYACRHLLAAICATGHEPNAGSLDNGGDRLQRFDPSSRVQFDFA